MHAKLPLEWPIMQKRASNRVQLKLLALVVLVVSSKMGIRAILTGDTIRKSK